MNQRNGKKCAKVVKFVGRTQAAKKRLPEFLDYLLKDDFFLEVSQEWDLSKSRKITSCPSVSSFSVLARLEKNVSLV